MSLHSRRYLQALLDERKVLLKQNVNDTYRLQVGTIETGLGGEAPVLRQGVEFCAAELVCPDYDFNRQAALKRSY